MKIILTSLLLFIIAVFTQSSFAAQASSPSHRVALLELYTSEGCSSCPPADRFLSKLKQSGNYKNQVIPLAFHVTYWDYIGWKDPFASKQYDLRQREIARYNQQGSIYTPQFVLAGKDFRRFQSFSKKLNQLSSEPARVDLVLKTEKVGNTKLQVTLNTDISDSSAETVKFYIALCENNLSSQVTDGENEGELLKHDFVVRKLFSPFVQKKADKKAAHQLTIPLDKNWQYRNLGVVAFAQDSDSGEILQVVRLDKL